MSGGRPLPGLDPALRGTVPGGMAGPVAPAPQTLRQAAHRAVKESMHETLHQAAYQRFLAEFTEKAPAALRAAKPELNEVQTRQIIEETAHLFQRPLDDPWMVKQLTAAKLPADRIIADYNQRLDTLNGMARSQLSQMGSTVKRVAATFGLSVIGGIAATWGGNRLMKKQWPALTRWARYPAALVTGAVGWLASFKIGTHLFPVADNPRQIFDGRAVDAQLAVHSGFVGEIICMTAMAYAKQRAVALCEGKEEGPPPPAQTRPTPISLMHVQPATPDADVTEWSARLLQEPAEAGKNAARSYS